MTATLLQKGIIFDSWTEAGKKVHYVAKLPSTTCDTPFDFLYDKENIFGQFAFFNRINESTYEAIRDPLGINKLFYTEAKNGQLFFSEHFSKLFRFNSKIFAIPTGKHVFIGSGGVRKIIKDISAKENLNHKLKAQQLIQNKISGEWINFLNNIQYRIKHVFEKIGNLENAGWKIFVALSGGLDSSIIANAAVQYLSNPVACTLNLGRSEDAEKASLIAQTLNIEHVVFNTNRNEILKAIYDSPTLCQDFRDFNVHCAALNLLLAKKIRNWGDLEFKSKENKLLILTGDLMNEYLCDYSEEIVGNKTYYRLPKIEAKELQRYLIRGIDTSDRELILFYTMALTAYNLIPYLLIFT